MYELKQDDVDGFESKFPFQDVGLTEEKCLQPLLEIKSEPKDINEDSEGYPKYFCTVKVEEEETKPFYQHEPCVKNQIQKMMYELKQEEEEEEENGFELKFLTQDVCLRGKKEEEEKKCLQPFLEVKYEPKDINEDSKIDPKYFCTIKVEEETKPFYHKVLCVENQIQVLDEVIRNENFANSDKKTKEDHKSIITVSDNSRPSSNHGNYVNLEVDRNSYVHVSNDRASCSTPIHTEKLQFSCEECGKSFNRRSVLRRHMHTHTGNQFSCEICGKSFTRSSGLKAHLFIHTGDSPFSCEVCGKSFTRRGALKTHLLIHTGNRPFSCEDCGKSFSDRRNLSTHMLIHTGHRPFSCEICEKSFSSISVLNQHSLVHTGSQFSCEDCGKSFKRRSNLRLHMPVHIGELPFSCEECGKSFTHRGALKTHMLVHIPYRAFTCEMCGKYFNFKTDLIRHLRIHTGDRPFSCEECGKSFTQKGSLKTHILSVHK